MSKISLFCFSYAGGTASMYYKWKSILNSFIKVIPVELKGRGSRSRDSFYRSFNEVVNDLEQIVSQDVNLKYAFFGYSFGGLLAYELYQRIREKKSIKTPCHLFIAARETPDSMEEKISHLPDNIFIQKVGVYGGLPEVVRQSKDSLVYFLPILRADFRLIDDYSKKYVFRKVDCDMSILYAAQDQSIHLGKIKMWKNFAESECHFHKFEGGHFFIRQNEEKIVNLINRTLLDK